MPSKSAQGLAAVVPSTASSTSFDLKNQASPASVVGRYRRSSSIPGRDVPLLTFGDPAQDSAADPYFVAVDFGDTRGIVHGTFDYLPHDVSQCQFLSMDQSQLVQGISCPPHDAHTVRTLLYMTASTWTVSVSGGAWITGTFPSTRTSTPTLTSTRARPTYNVAWITYPNYPHQVDTFRQAKGMAVVLFSVVFMFAVAAAVMIWRQMGRQNGPLAPRVAASTKSEEAMDDEVQKAGDEEELLPVHSR